MHAIQSSVETNKPNGIVTLSFPYQRGVKKLSPLKKIFLPFAVVIRVSAFIDLEISGLESSFKKRTWHRSLRGDSEIYRLSLVDLDIFKSKFPHDVRSGKAVFYWHQHKPGELERPLPKNQFFYNGKATMEVLFFAIDALTPSWSSWTQSVQYPSNPFLVRISPDAFHNENIYLYCDDVVSHIFNFLALKDQIHLALTCKRYSRLFGEKHDYINKYLSARYLSLGKGKTSFFWDWAKICAQAGAILLCTSQSSDSPSAWDLNDFLPIIWPEGKVCVMGSVQGAYFCSVGLNLKWKMRKNVPSAPQMVAGWGALTFFSLMDDKLMHGVILPQLFYDYEVASFGHHTPELELQKKQMRSMAANKRLLYVVQTYLFALMGHRSTESFEFSISAPPQKSE